MTFRTLSQLLEMVAGLEKDLGLADMLPLERDVMTVIGSIFESERREVKTEEIIAHPLLADVPRSSLHRALRTLQDRGAISHPPGCKAGRYVIAG